MSKKASRNFNHPSTNLQSSTRMRPQSTFRKSIFPIYSPKTLCSNTKTVTSKTTSYHCPIAFKMSASITINNTLVFPQYIHSIINLKVFSRIGSTFLTKTFKRPFWKLTFYQEKTKNFPIKTQYCPLNFLLSAFKIRNLKKKSKR